ncbi:pyocin knob domain-containing protein [Pseudomonas oryziphila]|uniref:Uncharacterized protein n=1 Tax=Pseudomonas entomophila TaxID=312306 RepID=A0A3Q8U1D0_9PSED|nr:pyocin knob domain-containing protein [Pseudomonas oryziphila]AZL69193.1 hypothetical protein EJA05_16320 [Pseudomonas oryziphila]
MTMQLVNLGTPPSGSDGDDPRTAFTRINSNFKQLDDTGLTGPIAAAREVANLNDASSPGKWIGTAAAANRPAGFTRSSIDVVEEVSGDLMQQATDKSTGRVANRVYTASTDTWSAWVIIGSGAAPGEPLPVDAGGTGGSTAEQARANLGLKSLATLDKAPIDQGGTGGATAAEARHNLGLEAAAASFTGANAAAPGAPGLVPAPAAGDQDKVLRGDGTWGVAPSAADVAALADSYASQQAAITNLQTKRRTYAAGAPASVVGLNSITIEGIPSWVTKITIILKDHAAATGAQAIRLRTAAGAVTTGYKGALINHAASSLAGFLTQTDAWFLTPTNVGAPAHGTITLTKTVNAPGSGGWVMEFNGCADASINVYDARGAITISSDVTGIDMYRFTAGQNWTAGTVSVAWE